MKLFSALLFAIPLVGTTPLHARQPVDPKAIPEAVQLLNWLEQLPTRQANRVVVGQQIKQKFDDDYDKLIVELQEKTGKWVGFFHTQSSENWVKTRYPHAWDVTYPRIYNMARRGAVPMILYNPRNPFDASHIQQAAQGDVDINDLLTPGNMHYDVLHQDLDILASGLKRLEVDGIPVIIRLFGEHTRSHFWFHQGHPYMSTDDFRRLWSHIVDYINVDKNVHNVLWCSEIASTTVAATGASAFDAYVDEKIDINAIQFKTNGRFKTLPLYKAYKRLNNKPIIVPQALFPQKTDLAAFIQNIQEHNPDICMFSAWGTLEGRKDGHQLIHNRNVEQLFEHPWIVTADETPFGKKAPLDLKPIPPSVADGQLDGAFAWNFNRAGNFEGWKNPVRSVHQMRVADNQLYVFYFGQDPVIAGPDQMNMPAAKHDRFVIRMMNHSTSKNLVLQWTTTEQTDWDEARSIDFAVEPNTLDYVIRSVDLSRAPSWSGTIQRVRLRLAPESSWDSAEIDYLGFVDRQARSQLRSRRAIPSAALRNHPD